MALCLPGRLAMLADDGSGVLTFTYVENRILDYHKLIVTVSMRVF